MENQLPISELEERPIIRGFDSKDKTFRILGGEFL